jgi:hypothetical protein
MITASPSKSSRNGWTYGTYSDQTTRRLSKGWFPTSYVKECHQTLPSLSVPDPSPSLAEQSTMPRFTETYHITSKYSDVNKDWTVHDHSQQHSTLMTNENLRSGFTSSNGMGSTVMGLMYSIKEGKECNNDYVDDYNNDGGFDVVANSIMGGTIPRGPEPSNNNGSSHDEANRGWGGNQSDSNDKNSKTKMGRWLDRKFGLSSISRKKVRPMKEVEKAKEPEWNAEPQIILPDGSIIQECSKQKRGLFSHITDAAVIVTVQTQNLLKHKSCHHRPLNRDNSQS